MNTTSSASVRYNPTADQRERWDEAIWPICKRMARIWTRKQWTHRDGWDFVQEVSGQCWKAATRAWEQGADPSSWAFVLVKRVIGRVIHGDRLAGGHYRQDIMWDRSARKRFSLEGSAGFNPERANANEPSETISFSVAHDPALDVCCRLDWETFLDGLRHWERAVLACYARGGKAVELEGIMPRHARHARRHLDRLLAAYLSR